MGWKARTERREAWGDIVAIRFRWIWVEKIWCGLYSYRYYVAIRFRWIWVEKIVGFVALLAFVGRNPLSLDMGWKGERNATTIFPIRVAIRFRWIWVEKKELFSSVQPPELSQSAFAGYGLKRGVWVVTLALAASRNPLSLDMGWKEKSRLS